MRVLGRVTSIALAVLAVERAAFAGETGVVQGKVTAVSDRAVSLVDEDGVVWNFEVSQGAQVYAAGASHKSKMLASSGPRRPWTTSSGRATTSTCTTGSRTACARSRSCAFADGQ